MKYVKNKTVGNKVKGNRTKRIEKQTVVSLEEERQIVQ